MKQRITFFILALSFISCSYKFSITESNSLANEFFNGKPPAEVKIPIDMQGRPHDKYKIQKGSFTFNNRNIKMFYAVSRTGLLGNMYVDGSNLNTNDTSSEVALTRGRYLKRLQDCGEDFICATGVMAELDRDCKLKKDKENCWYCEEFSGPGGDKCPWLE